MPKKAQPFRRTDAGNAELFASLYRNDVRHDHRQGRWLIWDDTRCRWNEDKQREVYIMAKRAARLRLQAAANIGEDEANKADVRWAIQSEMLPKLNAALSLAQSESPISDPGTDWDANPWLFGVDNGVVDLRTGKVRKELREDRITKHSPAQFDPKAKCPRFDQFISQVFGGDEALIHFMHKAVGYSLTGCVNEQCLFFNHGAGGNGKSTLFGVLKHIFGEYAVNLPFSALELDGRSSIPNDIAMLVGSRFVTAIETEESVRLNEARIKALTGGDPITARRLYRDYFTFEPTHKLWLAFNHKPRISDNSKSMWRRVRLIPFTQTFSHEQEDKDLLNTLKTEAPGVLAWAVQGCLLWHREELGMPAAVAEATAQYQAESDHVGKFLEECYVLQSDAFEPTAALGQRYKEWLEATGEEPLSWTVFAERLKSKGLRNERHGHDAIRGWLGIAPRTSELELSADALTPADTVLGKVPIGKPM